MIQKAYLSEALELRDLKDEKILNNQKSSNNNDNASINKTQIYNNNKNENIPLVKQSQPENEIGMSNDQSIIAQEIYNLQIDREQQILLKDRNKMVLAIQRGVILIKGMRECMDVTASTVKQQIFMKMNGEQERQKSGNKKKAIEKIKIVNCSIEILQMLNEAMFTKKCFIQKKVKIFEIKEIIIKGSIFNGVALKNLMYLFKDSLESIIIENARVENMTRVQLLKYLFVKSKTRPKRLIKIKSIHIGLLQSERDQGDEKEYEDVQRIMKEEIQEHQQLSFNFFENPIDLETKFLLRNIRIDNSYDKIILDEKCFTNATNYRYFTLFLKMYGKNIKVAVLLNINRIDSQILEKALIQLRNLKHLKTLCFIRFQIEDENMRLIKNFLFWKRYELEELYFVQCSLHDIDLKFVFFQENMQITDFWKLNKLVVSDNQFRLTEVYSTDQKYFQLRKIPEIITEGGTINIQNEKFLVHYLQHFSQTTLYLDNFQLEKAHVGTIHLIFQLIRSSKSLFKISFKNCNLNRIAINLRNERDPVRSSVEEIDLSLNKFEGDQKIVRIFSHFNTVFIKKIILKGIDFLEKDFEDLAKIFGLCINLKVLDFSYTIGMKGYDLIEILERSPNINHLVLRGCGLDETVLGMLNSKLYQQLTQEENNQYQTNQIDNKTKKNLLQFLSKVDLSQNQKLGSSMVDFLIYSSMISQSETLSIQIEDINFGVNQAMQFITALNEQRIKNIKLINLSKNSLGSLSTPLLTELITSIGRENKKYLQEIILSDNQLSAEQILNLGKQVLEKSKVGNIALFDISESPNLCAHNNSTFLDFFGFFKHYGRTLTKICLKNCSLQNLTSIEFSQLFSPFEVLESIDISYNPGISSVLLKNFIISLSNKKHLRELNLSYLSLSNSQMAAISDAFMGRPSSQQSHYTIEDELIESNLNFSLMKLDLSGNSGILSSEWRRLFNLLFGGQFRSFSHLVIQKIDLNEEIVIQFAEVVLEKHQNMNNFKSLDISNNSRHLNDQGFWQLVEALSSIRSFGFFYCRNNSLNTIKGQALCKLILANQIEILDISENGPFHEMDNEGFKEQGLSSQELINLFGTIDGSFIQEHLQKMIRHQQILDDPKRQFRIFSEDDDPLSSSQQIKKSNIIKLNLSGNGSLNKDFFSHLLKSVNSIGSACVSDLNVSHLNLKDKLEPLNRFLKFHIQELYSIDLSHNSMACPQSNQLLEILCKRFSHQLQIFNISYTDFSDKDIIDLSHQLAEKYTALREINLSGIQSVSPISLKVLLIGITLSSQNTLCNLILKDLDINPHKQDILVEMFTYNIFKSLKFIDFSKNRFIASDFATFIRSVSISCGYMLEKLSFSYCNLKGSQILQLAERFYEAGFQKLEELDISGNQVIVDSTQEILISSNHLVQLIDKIHIVNGKRFKKLHLRDMNLKDKWVNDIKILFEGLKSFELLSMVDISQNKTEEKRKGSSDIQQLTFESVVPFFEMIHFKFKKNISFLNFGEMKIENNKQLFPLLHHIVLKFMKLDTFVFARNEVEFLSEISSITQLQFKVQYTSLQPIFQEVIETLSHSLKYLDLRSQQLSDTSLYSIKDMKLLEYLDLSYNHLLTFQTILNLQNCSNLNTLKLFGVIQDEPLLKSLQVLLLNSQRCIDLGFDYTTIPKEYKKMIIESSLRQPIAKGNQGRQIVNSQGLNKNQLNNQDKEVVKLVYKQLPKNDVSYVNTLLYEFVTEEKINVSLDLSDMYLQKQQLQSLHCIYPLDTFNFEDLKKCFLDHINSHCLFISKEFINKFLQVFPVQPSGDEYVLFFLNDFFFSILKDCKVNQVIVDHPNYLIQPENYSKDLVVKLFFSAKKNDIKKIYLDYHLEIQNLEENDLLSFFSVIPPSSIKFQQNRLSLPFIQTIYEICSQHPYFSNCDIRSIKIKELTDELSVVFREKWYFLPYARQSPSKEIFSRWMFSFFHFLANGLYKEDLQVGFKAGESCHIPNWELFAWLLLHIFCLIITIFVIQDFSIILAVALPFLGVNYFVEFVCHTKSLLSIPESMPLIEEPNFKIIFFLNWKSYFLSALMSFFRFAEFFLIRLCFEQDLRVLAWICLGWTCTSLVWQIFLQMSSRFALPLLLSFEVSSTFYDQIQARNFVNWRQKKINRRQFITIIKVITELFPNLVFFCIFFQLSHEFKYMALWGILSCLLCILYNASLILMIKPYQLNQLDFDKLSEEVQSQIEQTHNNYAGLYQKESLLALNSIRTIFKNL